MVRWDVERAPTSVQLLVGLGAYYGLTAQTCLERTGLRVEDLGDPAAAVGARQELTVIANLLAALGDPPGIGLEAGIRYHLTTYGIWGFAMISSPSWRSAIDIGLRYLDLTFAFMRSPRRPPTPSATARSSGVTPTFGAGENAVGSTRRSWICRCPSPTSTPTRSPGSSAAS